MKEKMVLGAQMYTVRDFTKTPDDFARTMERIAKIGYKYVQVSGIGSPVGKIKVDEDMDAHMEVIANIAK